MIAMCIPTQLVLQILTTSNWWILLFVKKLLKIFSNKLVYNEKKNWGKNEFLIRNFSQKSKQLENSNIYIHTKCVSTQVKPCKIIFCHCALLEFIKHWDKNPPGIPMQYIIMLQICRQICPLLKCVRLCINEEGKNYTE